MKNRPDDSSMPKIHLSLFLGEAQQTDLNFDIDDIFTGLDNLSVSKPTDETTEEKVGRNLSLTTLIYIKLRRVIV